MAEIWLRHIATHISERWFPHAMRCDMRWLAVCAPRFFFLARHYDIPICYCGTWCMRTFDAARFGWRASFHLTFHVDENESHLNDILMTFKFISLFRSVCSWQRHTVTCNCTEKPKQRMSGFSAISACAHCNLLLCKAFCLRKYIQQRIYCSTATM